MSGLYILLLLAGSVVVAGGLLAIHELLTPAPGRVRVPFDCDTCGRESHIDVPADDVWAVLGHDVELVCGKCIPEEEER